MLTTTYEMLQKAYEGHYAVPAVNTQGEPMTSYGPYVWLRRSFVPLLYWPTM